MRFLTALLVLIALVATCLPLADVSSQSEEMVGPRPTPTPHASPAGTLQPESWETGEFWAPAELELVQRQNALRSERGRTALIHRTSGGWFELARWRSRDMALLDYFAHEIPWGSPRGTTFIYYYHLYSAYGISPPALSAENLAFNNYPLSITVRQAVDGWEDSPEHYAAIVSLNYRYIACGAYQHTDGKKLYTCLFSSS